MEDFLINNLLGVRKALTSRLRDLNTLILPDTLVLL